MNRLSQEQVEILIERVSKNPGLYDKKSSEYKRFDQRIEIWKEIATQVNVDEKQCRLAWRSLKDQFMRCVKLKKTERAAEQTRKYKYYDKLQFLIGADGTTRVSSDYDGDFDLSSSNPTREFSFVETTNLDSESVDPFTQDFLSETEAIECETEVTQNSPRRNTRRRTRRNSSTTEEESVYSKLPTKTTSITSKKMKTDDINECVNVVLEKVTCALNQQLRKQSETSRNTEYLHVLDGYLLQLSEQNQDAVKLEILNLVHSRKRAIDMRR